MGRIVITEFVSLDGVMEEPRWSFDFDRGPEGDKFKLDELFGSDVMLLGRVTYEGFAAAWPSMTDEGGFADRMNSIPKYVVSSTLKSAEWNNSKVIKGNLGAGIRLFCEWDHTNLELMDQKPTGSGVVLLTYRRVEQP